MADFYCVKLKLILELNGADHATEAGRQRDLVRIETLGKQGCQVLGTPGVHVSRESERVRQGTQQRVRERIR